MFKKYIDYIYYQSGYWGDTAHAVILDESEDPISKIKELSSNKVKRIECIEYGKRFKIWDILDV